MPGHVAHWQVLVAPSRALLEDRLWRTTDGSPPGATLVVVRSAGEAQWLTRRLGPLCPVVTLGRFLGRAGPWGIEDEDLLPDAVLRWLVEGALPGGYRDVARQHLAGVFLDAIHLLEQNAIRPPYPGEPGSQGELHLEEAHRALLEGLQAHHDAGRFAAFERVSGARSGTARIEVAFPAARRVVFFAMDRLSPAERDAVVKVTPEWVDVEWFVVGRPPGSGEHPGLAFTDPLVSWLAQQGGLEHVEAHGDDPLSGLFSLAPSNRRPLHDVFLDAPAPVEDPQRVDAAPRDRLDEARRLLARIRGLLDGGVAPHEVAVVVPALAEYAGLLEDLFAEYAVPVGMSYRGAIRTSAPGSLLMALLDALDSGLARDAVLDFLAHPLCGLRTLPGEGQRDLDAARLRVWFQEAGLNPRAGAGAGGWAWAFEALRAWRARKTEEKRKAGALDPVAARKAQEFFEAQLAGLSHWIEVLGSLRDDDDALSFIEGVRSLLDDARLHERLHRASRHASDPAYLMAAHRGLVAILDEVEDAFMLAGAQTGAARAVRETMRRLAAEHEVPLAVDPEEGVQVLSWRNARGRSFRHVFVVGATQDALPERDEALAVQELLGDRFGKRLERLDRAAEARRMLHGLLMDTRGTVTFSAPQAEGDAPLVRSVLLDELDEAFALQQAEVPRGVVYTAREAARAAVLEGRGLAVEDAYAGAARALVAERVHALEAGVYSGRVLDVGVRALDAARPVVRAEAVSAGRLSQFAKCAFRSFAVDALKVRAPRVRDEELDPRDKGSIVHDVLEGYVRAAVREHGSPLRVLPVTRAAHEALLLQEALAVVAENRRRSVAFQAFEASLLGGLPGASNPYSGEPRGLLMRFLDSLARFRDGEGIVAVEVPFRPVGDQGDGVVGGDGRGGTRAGDGHAGAQRLEGERDAEADGKGGGKRDGERDANRDGAQAGERAGDGDDEVEEDGVVDLQTPAGRVSLRGRIDRLDRLLDEDGSVALRVVEYKTGNVPRRELVEGGVEFQLPLYAVVAELMHPGVPVREAVYHQLKRPRDKEAVIRSRSGFRSGGKHDLGPLLAATPRRLGEILSAQAAGWFPLTLLDPKEAGCGWCELRRGCGLRTQLLGLRREAARGRRQGETDGPYVPQRVQVAGEGEGDEAEDGDAGGPS